MKNAKKILLVMILSAPLSIFSSESVKEEGSKNFKVKNGNVLVRKSSNNENVLDASDFDLVNKFSSKIYSREDVESAQAVAQAAQVAAVAAHEQASHEKRFQRSALVSALSCATLVGSLFAVKYAPEAAGQLVRDPRFVLGQAGLAGVAVASGASAVYEARQGGCRPDVKNVNFASYVPNFSYVLNFFKKSEVKPADKKEDVAK